MLLSVLLWSFAWFAPQGVASATPPPATATARLTGKVTRLDNDKPIAGATVRLQPTDGSFDPRTAPTARTDAQGTYTIDKLSAGSYFLYVTAEHYFPQDAVTTRPTGFGKRLDLVEGQQLDHVDLVLVPAAGIEGRALDEYGDPAPGVTMMVTQLMQAAGRSRLMPLGGRATAITDDRGAFRVPGLAPGDYFVVALSGPFGTQGAAMLSMPADTRAGFAPTYFPGTASAVDARPVHVEPGRDTTGLTFALVPSKLFTVSGRVVDPAGAPPGGVLQMLQTQGGDVRAILPANTAIDPDGAFAIRNVPQGSYVLQARARAGFGTALVTVGDRDVTDVAITLLPPTTARGRVTFQGGTPPTKEQVTIAVRPTDFVSGPVGGNALPRVRINDDWTFELPGLQSVGVMLAFAPPHWQLARVTVAGEDVTDKPFDFRLHDVTEVEVVLSDRWASVSATVTDVAGQPAPDCTVLVFSQDAAKWAFPSRHVLVARSNQQGVFAGGQLPGGSYLAVAVPQGAASGPEVDAALLEALRPSAVRVTLTDGEQTPIALKLVR